jgi:hypothetical protein
MRFLIDANMPRSIIALVASLGHEVEFAATLAWRPHRIMRSRRELKPREQHF